MEWEGRHDFGGTAGKVGPFDKDGKNGPYGGEGWRGEPAPKWRDTCGIGDDRLTIVAGPCMLESLELGLQVAEEMKRECERRGFGYIFKASFDKANRTSAEAERGPSLDLGLEWLGRIRSEAGVRVLTDIHESYQAQPVAEVVDMIQIPAFLCRQTDLLVAAARTGKPLNVKKAQFLAPEDMSQVIAKCAAAGAAGIVLCERGSAFGYHRLVVDFPSLPLMRTLGTPVMFDATHSVQRPGGMGNSSGGDRRLVLPLLRAAVAIGVDSVFMETHPDPEHAKCDGPNMVPLHRMRKLLDQIMQLDKVMRIDLGFTDLSWAG